MLVIIYNGNKPIGTNFKYSVQFNNKYDIVRVILNNQPFDFFDNFKTYVKFQNAEDDYYDRVLIDNPTYDDESAWWYVDFELKAQQTSHKFVDFQLSIEDANDEIVWGTQVARIEIANGIDADTQVADQYPSIIQYLLNNMGGGSDHDVQIEKVWLSYEKNTRYIFAGKVVGFDDEDNPFYNDASNIYVCFKTTPISEKDEEEIKNGRFVIRFDYPSKHKRPIEWRYNQGSLAPEIRQSKVFTKHLHSFGGGGYRSFAPNFLHKVNNENQFYQELYNTLLFVQESDIKTNAYGEKYIYKKVKYGDLINSFYSFKDIDNNNVDLSYVLNQSDINDIAFVEGLDGNKMGGVPWLEYINDMSNQIYFTTHKPMKAYATAHSNMVSGKGKQKRITKLDIPFTIYAPFKLSTRANYFLAFTPVSLSRRPRWHYSNNEDASRVRISLMLPTDDGNKRDNVSKYSMVAVKPRCCILNTENVETNGNNVWLKKYSQSDQNIRITCKEIMCEQYPLFRIFITKK